MRQTWKTFLFALIAIAALAGLDYGYRNYLRPRFGPPHEEHAEEGHTEEQHAEEQPALILELTGGKYFAQFGNPKAATKVIAYVPGHPCHNEAVKSLVESAEQFPHDLYVKILIMDSPPAMKALEQEGKAMCARYEINGQTSLDLLRPDGSTAKVSFEKRPGPGWTPEDLKIAVQQAIARAKPSSPGSPPPPPGPAPLPPSLSSSSSLPPHTPPAAAKNRGDDP